ncbi:MAG: class I SAM-dependent methyltransferase [Saprospiraceae bacterium]
MQKGKISNAIRALGLIYLADRLKYYLEKLNNKRMNKDFIRQNPDVKIPPDYLMYESYQLNYSRYFSDGLLTAKFIVSYINNYIELEDKKILDWGCGPGRIIRHLPNVMHESCSFYATDYNKASIDWCSKNLTGIKFNLNSKLAELPYEDNFFDVIYGISIFTHLSEKQHSSWYLELHRILAPNGILYLTTQGDSFKFKLEGHEVDQFNNNQLVVRDKTKVGHRTFSAFQPTAFMIKLFSNAEILLHKKSESTNGNKPVQDIWIIRKK